MHRSAETVQRAEEAQESDAAADDASSPIGALLEGPARRPADGPAASAPMPGVVRAVIVGAAEDGRPLVTWSAGSSAEGPVAAEPVWMQNPPRWAECAGLGAVVGFENGDSARPLLLGLLGTPPGCEDVAVPHVRDDSAVPQVRRIESGEELVLQCGEAKIVLRSDGTITIRGAKVVSRARGVNKIKGGSVEIN